VISLLFMAQLGLVCRIIGCIKNLSAKYFY